MNFHAAKVQVSQNIIHIPCLLCNTPKAVNAKKLPAPNKGFMYLMAKDRAATVRTEEKKVSFEVTYSVVHRTLT